MENKNYNWNDVKVSLNGREIKGIHIVAITVALEDAYAFKAKMIPTDDLQEEIATAESYENYEYCKVLLDELNKRTNK